MTKIENIFAINHYNSAVIVIVVVVVVVFVWTCCTHSDETSIRNIENSARLGGAKEF